MIGFALVLSPNLDAERLWTLGACTTERAGRATKTAFRLSDQEAVRRLVKELRHYVATYRPAELDRQLLEKLDAGLLRFRVAEVARWVPGEPCSADGTSEPGYLVQVFEKIRDLELARAVVSKQGVGISHRSPQEPWPIGPLPDLRVPLHLLPVRDPQFVETYSPHLRCSSMVPCIAFRSRHDHYLAAHGQLYRLHELPGVSFTAQLGTPAARAAFLASYESTAKLIVSLAGDGLAVAEPVSD